MGIEIVFEPENFIATELENLPSDEKFVVVPYQEYIQLKADCGRYKSLHERACKKNEELEEKLKKEQAKVRDLNHRLYGKKTEKSTTKADLKGNGKKDFVGPLLVNKRGAKKGRANRPRRKHPNLAVVDEDIELTDEQSSCPECGKAYATFPKTEDSDILEIEVKGYIRRIHRKMGKASCKCPEAKPLVTAPVAPRVYPKATIGVSVWTEILTDKYQYYTPSNRLYQRLESHDVGLSAGTVTNGLKKIAPLFEPIRAAMQAQQDKEELFHNDETGWKVFETIEGKVGYKWFLWVTRSLTVINFTMATGRSTEVIEDCFANHSADKMIIICDRYSAYKKFAKNKEKVILAFCWAHVRRDFLDYARSTKANNAWMFQWVERIAELYHINNQRIKYWDQNRSLTEQSDDFNKKQQELKESVKSFETDFKQSRKAEKPKNKGEVKTERFKVLDSLNNHWEGLTVFVENPQVPMDNNAAEQALRMPVAGRGSFYGSGSIWSALFAAIMMGWIKTLTTLWGLNAYTWIRTYLQACAENSSASPEDLSCFLPWTMTEEQKTYFKRPYSASTPIPKAKDKQKNEVEIQDSS